MARKKKGSLYILVYNRSHECGETITEVETYGRLSDALKAYALLIQTGAGAVRVFEGVLLDIEIQAVVTP